MNTNNEKQEATPDEIKKNVERWRRRHRIRQQAEVKRNNDQSFHRVADHMPRLEVK